VRVGVTTGPEGDRARYELIERVESSSGQGGVHRAVLRSELVDSGRGTVAAGTIVSLKQIDPGALGGHRIEELHEAVAARRHPGLGRQLEVFRAPPVDDDVDRPGGGDVLCVTAVWVDGTTLSRRAPDASVHEIVDWTRQIAEALDFLHADVDRHGPLLHRDIKPSNIVVTPDGRAVLIDPGLARTGPSAVTGSQYGTPGFIPPECEGDPTAGSPAGDRWQLAATLVAALVGRPPRRVGDRAALTAALVERSRTAVAHPTLFAEAVLDGLASSPDDRPAPAGRWVASVQAAAAPPFRRPRSRRRLLVVSGLALLAVGGVALVLTLRLAGNDAPRDPGITVPALIDTRRTSGASVDDQRRAYLSTQPIPWCRAQGCDVPGGAVASGMHVTLTCRTTGLPVTNGNPVSALDDDNPILFRSEVWYGVRLEDGTRGLLSEVWIHPDDRGARGLPFC
jgi:hypothetical protein